MHKDRFHVDFQTAQARFRFGQDLNFLVGKMLLEDFDQLLSYTVEMFEELRARVGVDLDPEAYPDGALTPR